MIIIAGSIRIEKLDLAKPHIAAIIAGTRSEPGCLAYSMAHDAIDPGLVRVFELFANAEAVAAHRASPHMAEWRSHHAEIGLTERNLSEYEIASFKKA
jgi:quinol monooxygenase YgiN